MWGWEVVAVAIPKISQCFMHAFLPFIPWMYLESAISIFRVALLFMGFQLHFTLDASPLLLYIPCQSFLFFFFFFFFQSRDTVMFRVFYYNLESCYLYSQVFGKDRLLGSPLSDRKILNTVVLKLTSSIRGIAGLWNRWCREICHSWLIDLWMQNLCVARSRNL